MIKFLQILKFMQFGKRGIVSFLRRIPIIRQHYRLRSRKECVRDACNLIHNRYMDLYSRASIKKLEIQLSWLGINFTPLYTNLKSDLYALFANQPMQPYRYDELKQELMQTPLDLLPCWQWLNLYEMCCFLGRYTLGQILREKARLLAIKPIKGRAFKPSISWENTIGAAIEGGECNCLEHLDELLRRAKIKGEAAIKWRLYLQVFNGHNIPWELVKSFDGTGFADYLASKTVAIVGPAPTEALDAGEIDSHDLIVRFNHSYEFKCTDNVNKGVRTDVTYFNGAQGKNFIIKHNGQLPGEVTWGCFKSSDIITSIIQRNKNKCVRSLVVFNQNNFHGSFNMMTIVALDIALFTSDTLKIYHADLMLSVMRQKGYYPKDYYSKSFDRNNEDDQAQKERFRWSSIVHDPIQQYRTLNNLWRNKKITGDARFVEVMQMGLDAYLLELERLYAKPYA